LDDFNGADHGVGREPRRSQVVYGLGIGGQLAVEDFTGRAAPRFEMIFGDNVGHSVGQHGGEQFIRDQFHI